MFAEPTKLVTSAMELTADGEEERQERVDALSMTKEGWWETGHTLGCFSIFMRKLGLFTAVGLEM